MTVKETDLIYTFGVIVLVGSVFLAGIIHGGPVENSDSPIETFSEGLEWVQEAGFSSGDDAISETQSSNGLDAELPGQQTPQVSLP